MLLDMKVAEHGCNCEKCHKHYYSGNLLNKNVITEIKFDPFSPEKNPTQVYLLFIFSLLPFDNVNC